jgi:hypothetical protein
MSERQDPRLRDAVTDCIDAYATCKETIAYSLEDGGELADARLIVTLLSCSDICRTTAEFIVTEADLASDSCQFCAVVCERCAARCDQWPEDEQMRLCAEAVRRVTATCLAVAAGGYLQDEIGGDGGK